MDFFRRIHLGITLPGLGQSDNKNGEVFFQLVPVISFQQNIHEHCQEGWLPHGHVPKQVREGVIVQILGPLQSIAATLLKTVPTRVCDAKSFGILHLSDPDLSHLYYQFVDFRYLDRVKPRVQVEPVEKKESKAIGLSYAWRLIAPNYCQYQKLTKEVWRGRLCIERDFDGAEKRLNYWTFRRKWSWQIDPYQYFDRGIGQIRWRG